MQMNEPVVYRQAHGNIEDQFGLSNAKVFEVFVHLSS
jgi:hypothetical protein